MTSSASSRPVPTKKAGSFPILDALRFVLAFWATVGHFGMPSLLGDPTTGTGYWFLLKRGWNTVVFGTPAVIVFFVISGFCIHLPFRGLAEMLHFKLHISYTLTMVWFGVLAFLWVRAELAHGKISAPNHYLVAAGAWSYSLHLVHVQGAEVLGPLRLPSLGPVLDWPLSMASSIAFAYLFFLLVERPSHRLARKIRAAGSWKARLPESGFIGAGLPHELPAAPEKGAPPLKGIVGDES